MHVPGNTAQLLLAYPAYPAAEAVPGIIAPSKRAQFEAWGKRGMDAGDFFVQRRWDLFGLGLYVVKKFPKANTKLRAWNWSR